MAEITLEFLSEQQDRMLLEMSQFRDDMRVMVAITERVDGTLQGLVHEIRATHAQIARLVQRLEKLEKA